MSALPEPGAERWQPLRVGLVDIFYYDTEEFWFRDGRLLLRGNNGTGKSKVLALTLPFLLDGELSAHRVEPDGDPKKRMEWNLLLGGEHPHPERLGYTWIEFGRRDAHGTTHYRTLACGLKAVSGRGIARHWYAVTEQRVGAELNLLDATGTALTRDRLAEAVAGRGKVYDQATTYRRAVDEALFGLGERRYGALVDLLVQLRQPQLSKRPNEAALSRALSEALPPVDQAVVADVAEAFRSLDEEKEELRAAAEAERAATAFLDHYRRYARVATRRRARLPRQEQSRYEKLNRDLVQVQGAKEHAEGDRGRAAASTGQLEELSVRLAAQDAALRADPGMRDAYALDQAAIDERRTAGERDRAAVDHTKAKEAGDRALGRFHTAQHRLHTADNRLAGVLGQAEKAASAARLDGEVRVEGAPEPELRREAEENVARRRRTVDHVEELIARAERAGTERQDASRRVDEAERELSRTREQRSGTERLMATSGQTLIDAVREHAAGCAQLVLPDPVGLLDRLQEWVTHLNGPYPARYEAAEAHRALDGGLADQFAALTQRHTLLRERKARAETELAGLEAGGQSSPAAPYTRTPGRREREPGAPLWRLVDFRDELTGAERAGLEAALEASGLLDAWVCPDGTALAPGSHDVVLVPAGQAAGGPSLAEALRPAVDHGDPRAVAVGERTVAGLLTAVGLGEGAGPWTNGTSVTLDGRFRVGALAGSWAKTSAEYVGEGAREEARRGRITELGAEIAALETECVAASSEQEQVAERRRVLDAELASVPDDGALRHAYARADAARAATDHAVERRDASAAELAARDGELARARKDVADTANDLDLPPDRESLADIREALGDYTARLAELWPTLQERSEATRAVSDEREEAETTGERAAELALRAEESVRAHASAETHLATLRSTVGSAVAELQRQLAETATAARECERNLREARGAHTRAEKAISRAEGQIEQLESDVTTATRARTEAIGSLQRFAATGLFGIALPGVDTPDVDGGPWAATPAVALARTAEAELATTDDSDAAWERVQRHLSGEYKKLQDALSRHGHTASARMVEDGMIVDIVYQGRERAVPELAGALTAEVGELQRILSAHEREILETHLLTEVAGTLQELIGMAERQVMDMNGELEERPTSTGMKLRLVWRPSRKAPPGLAQVRERLRQSADAWTPEERAAVGEFLQAQITAQQTSDRPGSWLEHLTAALDYRAWHEFGVERHQNGRWVSATGPASGGERVLAVSVPLFAAASSHYATAANPYAPRLVTLDEAFAGVDDDSRAKCLGLLHAFDLDVVMTSEREWACYPQVPGIAIAQLSRTDELAAVLVTRWEWDGRSPTRGTEPERMTAPVQVPVRAAPEAGQDGLWE